MTAFVRVTDLKTGYHTSIPEAFYQANKALFRLLKEDAFGSDGRVRPAEYPRKASPAPAGGKAAEAAKSTTEA